MIRKKRCGRDVADSVMEGRVFTFTEWKNESYTVVNEFGVEKVWEEDGKGRVSFKDAWVMVPDACDRRFIG